MFKIVQSTDVHLKIETNGKLDKGVRVIELYEGERKFDSWIHTLNDAKKYLFPIRNRLRNKRSNS